MTKVTCSGLGSGSQPYSKEVPTIQMYPNMSTEGVEVVIPLKAYIRLVNWASMGRTLGGAISALAKDEDSNWEIIEELNEVREALDKCHQAVREHWGKLGKLP